MGSRYSVIQYVPDPIADERINIGAIAFDDEVIKVRFLQNWERVKDFGSHADHTWLRDFAKRMQASAEKGLLYPGDAQDGAPNHERLQRVVRSWQNSLQFTEMRGAILKPEPLLNSVAQNYLVDPKKQGPALRNRQAAAGVAQKGFRNFFLRRYGQEWVQELLKKDYSLQGQYKPQHKFDIALANGQPYVAAHAISFEVHPPETLQDAIAFMVAEVKHAQRDLPLAIVALPPTERSREPERLESLYGQMTKTYQELGAQVVSEAELEPWLDEEVGKIDLISH